MPIKDRILEFTNALGIQPSFFGAKIFGSPNFFTSDEEVKMDHLIKLSLMYIDLNMYWILSGKGKMFYQDVKQMHVNKNGNFIKAIDDKLIQDIDIESPQKQRLIANLQEWRVAIN